MASNLVYFQGADLAMSSGVGANPSIVDVQRVQDIQVDFSIPRQQTQVLGRFIPLNDQPVINYTPVSMSVSYTKGNKDVERCLGLLNDNGIGTIIGQGTSVADAGARNYTITNIPTLKAGATATYDGQWTIQSGVLKSFSLQGSVGEAVKGSFSVEGLNLVQASNTQVRAIPNYSSNLIKPEGVTLAGLTFTGFGLTGFVAQSFAFQASFDHVQSFRLGSKLPECRVTNIGTTLQLVGFMEGPSNQLNTDNFDCGAPYGGLYQQCILNLQPSCSTEAVTNIIMNRPYLTSESIGMQVGNFTQVTLNFATPASIVISETSIFDNFSNVYIT